ncbi:ornithine carbamoyltransferase [Spiroplasma endosymbiont of Polydrusus pterygomalis]|uniref:ornithine carbamoyltransferase n=1 Tax=Spiroplasma endosymbiont of Polydrusus pterygomalis TaxID=3139327 RepID=UPI003CCB2EC3
MAINLKGRNFICLLDFTREEIYYLLELSATLKIAKQKGTEKQPLKGYNIALLYQKDSRRTRSAFEVAAYDLGMHSTYFGPTGSQIAVKESISDTAKVLGKIYNGIQFRGYKQTDIEDLAQNAGVPVWNALTDLYHPTQMLADIMTIQECKKIKDVKGIKFVYFGDARFNMANSYMIISAKLGMNLVICSTKNLWPYPQLLKQCQDIAQETGGSITLTVDYKTASKDADVVATDVWISMGEDKKIWKQRIKDLIPYQVNKEKMKIAKPNAIFLHCLPSFHDDKTQIAQEIIKQYGGTGELEVTDEVFQSSASKIFQQSENHLHTIKAVMLATLK